MLNLHVVFAVDRAGLVGEDGETHHGVFDVGFLRQAPNMTVLCPASKAELTRMLQWAVEEHTGPVAIRYPRGTDRGYSQCAWTGDVSQVHVHTEGTDAAIITYGAVVENAVQAARLLQQQGISVKVIRLLAVNPLPMEAIQRELAGIDHVSVLEEVSENSGICHVLAGSLAGSARVQKMNLGGGYVPHGSTDDLYRHCGLDRETIANTIKEALRNEN